MYDKIREIFKSKERILTLKDKVVVLRRFREGIELYDGGMVGSTHYLHLWLNVRTCGTNRTEGPCLPLRMFARCIFRVRIEPGAAIRKDEKNVRGGIAPQSLVASS